MKYKIIHTRETDNYTRHLEELSNKGFRVISAGMTANPALKCFDWWAVLEEAPVELVEKKPKDETAEMLEVLRDVKRKCNARGCDGCEFSNGSTCGLAGIPGNWVIRRG